MQLAPHVPSSHPYRAQHARYRAAASLQTSASAHLGSSRPCAPLLPDLRFIGRSWKEWADGYACRWGRMPEVFRVVRLSKTRVAISELRVDADGYGRVKLIGAVDLHAFARVLDGLMGPCAHAIVDTSLLPFAEDAADGRWVDDARLHDAVMESFFHGFGADIETWRARIGRDLMRRRSLPTRAALERVRAEMVMWVAQVQSTH